MLVFDSNAFIAFLRGEKGAQTVRSIFDSGEPCYVHSINFAEVFYDISRGADVLQAREALRGFVHIGVIERTDMDAAFREDVAQLKADWRRISLADCCGLALARRLNAEFVTADHHEMDVLNAAHVARLRFFR